MNLSFKSLILSLLLQLVSNSNLHSCVHNDQWIFMITSLYFGAVEISLNDTLKTFTSEFMITKSELHDYFACEFTAYCTRRNAGIKTTTTTNFTFCQGQEHKTTTFLFFSWTFWYSPLEFSSRKIHQNLSNCTRWNKCDKLWGSANSLFKWLFCSHRRIFFKIYSPTNRGLDQQKQR